MSENLRQVLEIVGQDQASAELRGVIETLVKLERQAKRTGEMLKTATGGDLAKRFEGMKVEAAAFTDGLSKGAGKASTAMVELRDSMREVEAEQRKMVKAPKVAVPTSARPDRALADDAVSKVVPASSQRRQATETMRAPETAASVPRSRRLARPQTAPRAAPEPRVMPSGMLVRFGADASDPRWSSARASSGPPRRGIVLSDAAWR